MPQIASHKTGKNIAIVGSGPAGLSAGQQLARAGHRVVIFEKNDRIGGLLRYGIPDFKLEKHHIERRMAQMQAEGVEFLTQQHVGVNLSADELLADFDAVLLAGGAEVPRDLPIAGRELDGVSFAMPFLSAQNKVVAGDKLAQQLTATGKHVIVIGGGDTGSDCVGTSNRQGALSVTQLELMPQPPAQENKPLTWPYWPLKLRSSSSHEEGAVRDWAVTSRAFLGKDGKVTALECARVTWQSGKLNEIAGSNFTLPADLVLLAMGFISPSAYLLEAFGVSKDMRGNAQATTDGDKAYATNHPKVFAAGDMRRGQSLVVWAIREGRQAAHAVDAYLMGSSTLPR